MTAADTPRARLLALANGNTPRAEVWRRAVVAMIDDLNRAVHHERFRRLARYSRAPKESRIDVRPYPTGGASARVALGEGASIPAKALPAFREAVRLVAEHLHKPKRGPFKVAVRFDHPEDESRPDLWWPLGTGPSATGLWNDLLGEPKGSPWRRIPAVPHRPLGREMQRPPAPLALPPLPRPTKGEVLELLLREHHRLDPRAFDQLVRGAKRKRREAIARHAKGAASGIRRAVVGAPDAARVVRAVRRMATSPHDARTLRPAGRRSRRAGRGAA